MTKDKLKDDIIRTICCLNSDISNKDRKLLIELLNSIVDYTNNIELEQDVKVITQKHNELAETVNELKTKVETNKKADYNWVRGNNGQDTDKAVRVLLLGGRAFGDSVAGSGHFYSGWVQSVSSAHVGFFTTVKLD